MHRIFFAIAIVCLAGSAALAQDPVKVDPKHYKVLMENDQVRVLHIHYGPHEKSVMHFHPDSVVVYVTDIHGKFNFPDGKSTDASGNAGDTLKTPAVTHLPENTGDKAFDAVLVEFKKKPTQ